MRGPPKESMIPTRDVKYEVRDDKPTHIVKGGIESHRSIGQPITVSVEAKEAKFSFTASDMKPFEQMLANNLSQKTL